MIPICIFPGLIILCLAFFTPWEPWGLCGYVTRGLRNPHDCPVFTSRTDGTLCHREHPQPLPHRSSPWEAGVSAWEPLRHPPLPRKESRRDASEEPHTVLRTGSRPLQHSQTRWFPSGRCLQTLYFGRKDSALSAWGRVFRSPEPPGRVPGSRVI